MRVCLEEKQKNIYMKMYAAFRGYSSEASEIIKRKNFGKGVLFDIFKTSLSQIFTALLGVLVDWYLI